MRITFTCKSVFTPMADEPYVGVFECEATRDVDILETIFVRGNAADSGAEPFPDWAQPSCSMGDTIHFHAEGEGVGVIHSYIVAGMDFIPFEEINSVSKAQAIQDRFATVNPHYAVLLQNWRDRVDRMRREMWNRYAPTTTLPVRDGRPPDEPLHTFDDR